MSRFKSQQSGFTILEVLIVLAVGGIILLIVFQAIPTLTRNARNNQRKQDVAAILEAVSHYELNNSGAMPADCGGGGGDTECTDSTKVLGNTELNYYQNPSASGNVSIKIKTLTSGDDVNNTNPSAIDKVAVYNYQHCDQDNAGKATPNGAGFRDVVALYAIETRTTFALQCTAL